MEGHHLYVPGFMSADFQQTMDGFLLNGSPNHYGYTIHKSIFWMIWCSYATPLHESSSLGWAWHPWAMVARSPGPSLLGVGNPGPPDTSEVPIAVKSTESLG